MSDSDKSATKDWADPNDLTASIFTSVNHSHHRGHYRLPNTSARVETRDGCSSASYHHYNHPDNTKSSYRIEPHVKVSKGTLNLSYPSPVMDSALVLSHGIRSLVRRRSTHDNSRADGFQSFISSISLRQIQEVNRAFDLDPVLYKRVPDIALTAGREGLTLGTHRDQDRRRVKFSEIGSPQQYKRCQRDKGDINIPVRERKAPQEELPRRAVKEWLLRIAGDSPGNSRSFIKTTYSAEFLATLVAHYIGLSIYIRLSILPPLIGLWIIKCLCASLAATIGIYIGGGVSGSHMNPGLTLAVWHQGRLTARDAVFYIIAQFLACLIALTLIWYFYKVDIITFDPDQNPFISSGLFYWSRDSYHTLISSFLEQGFAACIFAIVLLALNDSNNVQTGELGPLVMGLSAFVLSITFSGMNILLNPVKDLAGRVLAATIGYGAREPWYDWEPYVMWVASGFGMHLGAWLYASCVT